MSRFAEVVVLAADAQQVMAPLTRENDGSRPWHNLFVPIESQWPGSFGRGWAAEFTHRDHWADLLAHLQSLPWPRPETVQVLIHDEEDDCFGLWMLYDGKLVEVPLPHTARYSEQSREAGTGTTTVSYLCRTDTGQKLPDLAEVDRQVP